MANPVGPNEQMAADAPFNANQLPELPPALEAIANIIPNEIDDDDLENVLAALQEQPELQAAAQEIEGLVRAILEPVPGE